MTFSGEVELILFQGSPASGKTTFFKKHFKAQGYIGEEFEHRTEAVIAGVACRAHPNYQGDGPWYDFAMVRFEHPELGSRYVDDKHMYPAKILGFFRRLPPGWMDRSIVTFDEDADLDFSVLVHSASFQRRHSEVHERRTLLTRTWLYEVKQGLTPPPAYSVAGTTRSNVVLGEHIFAVEEQPGFHDRYATEEERRFIVLSDMRQVWPHVFINGSSGFV